MLELRRGRSQSRDSPLMGTHHELEIDILGITGITLDRSKLIGGVFSKKSQKNGLAPPEKTKAVVAVFSNGEFCASSGLSHHLRKAPSQSDSAQNENLIAMWSKRSRTSKIKFDTNIDDSTNSSDPAFFEVWVALTDGKGENKTCVSFPIGLGNLPVQGAHSKPILLDLPIGGLAKKEDGSGSTGSTHGLSDDFSGYTPSVEEKKDDDTVQEPTVGSVYGLKSYGGSVLRIKVECKRKKLGKKERRRASKLADVSEDKEQLNPLSDDDEGSKMFRPIETSSLVSESAYSLGDVVSSRLPTRTIQKNRALFGDFSGGIDESQEMDFSDIASKPSDRSGKPSLEYGPKSAFTAISANGKTITPTSFASTMGKSEPPEKTPTHQTPESAKVLHKEPAAADGLVRIHRKPTATRPFENSVDEDLDVPNLRPSVPNLLDDMDVQKRSKKSATMGSFEQVPLVIKTVSEIRGKSSSAAFPKPPRIDARSRPGQVPDEEASLARSLVSTAMKKDDSMAWIPPGCGLFGTMLQIPITMLMQDNDEEKVLRDFEDDHTWSTIETRNSSQIVAWHDSVRAYANETSSLAGQNRGVFDQQCGATVTSTARDRQCSVRNLKNAVPNCTALQKKEGDLGWWNDLPGGGGNGCL